MDHDWNSDTIFFSLRVYTCTFKPLFLQNFIGIAFVYDFYILIFDQEMFVL
jgi:hypothetical protein